MRSPVAAKMALQTAGNNGGSAGSPKPVGALLVFRKCTSMSGGTWLSRVSLESHGQFEISRAQTCAEGIGSDGFGRRRKIQARWHAELPAGSNGSEEDYRRDGRSGATTPGACMEKPRNRGHWIWVAALSLSELRELCRPGLLLAVPYWRLVKISWRKIWTGIYSDSRIGFQPALRCQLWRAVKAAWWISSHGSCASAAPGFSCR